MKKVLCAGEISVDLVLQGYTEFPVPGREVLVRDSQLVLRRRINNHAQSAWY